MTDNLQALAGAHLREAHTIVSTNNLELGADGHAAYALEAIAKALIALTITQLANWNTTSREHFSDGWEA